MQHVRSVAGHLVVLLVPLLLAGCCTLGEHCSVPAHEDLTGEGPFPDRGTPPGVAYVLGTADFGPGGGVQIKIQVDAVSISGTEDSATIQAWSGNGATRPTDTSGLPPAGATMVYDSGGDVALPHWTIHLDRSFDSSADRYWLVVKVDRRGSGTNPRKTTWLYWEWLEPDPTAAPDAPHEFNTYL